MKKINIKIILLYVYLILSFSYILYGFYGYMKFYIYNVGFQNGKETIIKGIISETTKSCNAFTVYMGKEKVDLINIKCLKNNKNNKNNSKK